MNYYNNDYLQHYGVKGMKWGVRKYADKNGRLNAAGRKRYGVNSVDEWKSKKREMRSRKDVLEKKADKKYKVSTYEAAKKYEDSVNENARQRHRDMFGTSAFAPTSTYHKDAYDRQAAKAKKYIDDNMTKEFGKSYETWKSNNETIEAIAGGALVVAGMGLIVGTKIAQTKM